MSNYSKIASEAQTEVPTQTEKARPDQFKNNAGGYVFEVGPWKQLDRNHLSDR